MTGALLGGALLATLAGSPHCVAMCGGFATAAGGGKGTAAWHAGRLLTYASLGAVAGYAGHALPGGGWIATGVAIVMLAWFAARLAGVGPAFHLAIPGLGRAGAFLARRGGLGARLLFGMLTGLLPCGLVWSSLALSVAAGSPLAGAGVMAAAWLGTLPALSVAAGALRRLSRARPYTRGALAVGVFAIGLWSIGARGAFRPAAADPTAPPACHSAPEVTP
jgi:sulfite exporter TauE/SafE